MVCPRRISCGALVVCVRSAVVPDDRRDPARRAVLQICEAVVLSVREACPLERRRGFADRERPVDHPLRRSAGDRTPDDRADPVCDNHRHPLRKAAFQTGKTGAHAVRRGSGVKVSAMRKYSLIFLTIILVIILCACSWNEEKIISDGTDDIVLSDEEIAILDAEETFEEGHGELAIEYQSMDDMVNDADLIAEITADELQVVYNEFNLPKTHTSVVLNHVIRKENAVNVTKGQKITVIEEGGTDGFLQGGIPQMEKGTEYILFLQEYENNYYICGAFQGRFILKSGYAFQQGWERVKLKEYYPLQREAFIELIND